MKRPVNVSSAAALSMQAERREVTGLGAGTVIGGGVATPWKDRFPIFLVLGPPFIESLVNGLRIAVVMVDIIVFVGSSIITRPGGCRARHQLRVVGQRDRRWS